MYSSIEARSPFLDKNILNSRFVEYHLTLKLKMASLSIYLKNYLQIKLR